MPSITLPARVSDGKTVTVQAARSVVFVGANGSGKSRLGTALEQQAGQQAHRISAQRSLQIPALVQPRGYEQAESSLLYGIYQPAQSADWKSRNKWGSRWGNQPATHMLTDYEHLLALLFADETKRDHEYTRAAMAAPTIGKPPRCRLDDLRLIWDTVMPQRALVIEDNRIQAQSSNGTLYQADQLSDGERVAIYLIGQALCAPAGGVVIIDEPEIHLHRALQAPLWDQIEKRRSDCMFVYITHDVDFAATRVGGRRFWVKSFDGSRWEWDEVVSDSPLPDSLTLQILGTRREILFVEGDDSSYDAKIYAALFPNECVVPRETCKKVIEATKALASLPQFHHLKGRGIVDRDRRGNAEIDALEASSITVADVAEVENLLCIPEALRAAAIHLKAKDPDADIERAKSEVLNEFSRLRNQQALARALAEVQFSLNGFGPKIGAADVTKLEAELSAFLAGIQVSPIVQRAKNLIGSIVASADYNAALRYFNNKGILPMIARSFGTTKAAYSRILISLVEESPNGDLAIAMRARIRTRA